MAGGRDTNPADSPGSAPPDEGSLVELATLSECKEWETGVYVRNEMNPAQVPPEWAINNTFGMNSIVYTAWECHRLGLGALERPARLVLESHSKATPPPACDTAGDEFWRVINHIWTDDPVIAEALSHGLDLNAEVVAVEVARSSTTTEQATISWGSGGHTSQLTFDSVGLESGDFPAQFTYFWFASDGVVQSRFTGSLNGPNARGPAAYGEMAPDLLYHEAVGPYFVGGADIFEAEYEAHTIYYEDLLCKKPR